MKHFKRIAAAAIAVMMVFAMCVSTFAASITVTGGTEGQEYSAYLIFNLETIKDGETVSSYIYYLDADSDFYDLVIAYIDSFTGSQTTSGITLIETTRTRDDGAGGTETVKSYEVQVDSDFDAAAFAAYLKAAIDADKGATYTAVDTKYATAGSGNIVTAVLTADEDGYYFIKTDLGTLAILDSSTGTLKVTEKNTIPSPTKEATTINGETSDGTVKIGDTVGYTITVDVGEGVTAYNIVVNDTLSEGLTFDGESTISIYDSVYGSSDLWDTSDYEVEVKDNGDGTTTVYITLLSSSNGGSRLSSVPTNGKIYISYTATINENAASYSNSTSGITNDVTLTYGRDGDYTTEKDTEEVDTFRFGIYKTDGTNGLSGAVFNVKDSTDTVLGFVATTGAEPDEFVYYRLATADELADPDTYGVVFDLETVGNPDTLMLEGLDAGTYTIEEIEAPTGYNMLNGTITVEIDADGNRTYTYNGSDGQVTSTTSDVAYVTVKNSTGSVLPETGGMGTKIFYTLGGILVVGAGILLITKRRMSSAK